jgi:CheY-like chemotaxis protein
MRILVVDDVGYVRHYLDRLLTQHGHSVVTAASGMAALELLKQDNAIQAVITDLLMPGMDGLELFKKVQRIDRFDDRGPLPPPVFILMTALRPTSTTPKREANMLQEALDLGFADVLLKPIDNEHLLRQLTSIERKLHRGKIAGSRTGRDFTAKLQALSELLEKILGSDDREALAQLTDLLHASLARADRAIQELDARSPEPSGNFEQTLQTLQSLTDSVISTEDSEAVLTMCRELENQAKQLKQKIADRPSAAVDPIG